MAAGSCLGGEEVRNVQENGLMLVDSTQRGSFALGASGCLSARVVWRRFVKTPPADSGPDCSVPSDLITR